MLSFPATDAPSHLTLNHLLVLILLNRAEFAKTPIHQSGCITKCQYETFEIHTCNIIFLMCHSWGACSNPNRRSVGASVVANPTRACAILVTLNWSPFAKMDQCLPVGVLGTYFNNQLSPPLPHPMLWGPP